MRRHSQHMLYYEITYTVGSIFHTRIHRIIFHRSIIQNTKYILSFKNHILFLIKQLKRKRRFSPNVPNMADILSRIYFRFTVLSIHPNVQRSKARPNFNFTQPRDKPNCAPQRPPVTYYIYKFNERSSAPNKPKKQLIARRANSVSRLIDASWHEER